MAIWCFPGGCAATCFSQPQWSVTTETGSRVAGESMCGIDFLTVSSSALEFPFQYKWNDCFRFLCLFLFYGATKPWLAKSKGVVIHHMMNGVCRRSNNCFAALSKTMGECDLRAGAEKPAHQRWTLGTAHFFLCWEQGNFLMSVSVTQRGGGRFVKSEKIYDDHFWALDTKV